MPGGATLKAPFPPQFALQFIASKVRRKLVVVDKKNDLLRHTRQCLDDVPGVTAIEAAKWRVNHDWAAKWGIVLQSPHETERDHMLGSCRTNGNVRAIVVNDCQPIAVVDSEPSVI